MWVDGFLILDLTVDFRYLDDAVCGRRSSGTRRAAKVQAADRRAAQRTQCTQCSQCRLNHQFTGDVPLTVDLEGLQLCLLYSVLAVTSHGKSHRSATRE